MSFLVAAIGWWQRRSCGISFFSLFSTSLVSAPMLAVTGVEWWSPQDLEWVLLPALFQILMVIP
jgi:hypothetical protein